MASARSLTDPNRNRSAIVFDALGMVVGTAVMGTAGENFGHVYEGTFDLDLDPATVARADAEAGVTVPFGSAVNCSLVAGPVR